jgi:cation transport ATPase
MIIIAIWLLKGIVISLSPMYASIAMVLSSLTVITNSGGLRK